jgi:phosphohistidine phosphatase
MIKNYPDNYSSVAIIAHNPGLTNLINEITNISLDNLPTTGLAEIDFNCLKWNEVSFENSNLIEIKFPRQLK